MNDKNEVKQDILDSMEKRVNGAIGKSGKIAKHLWNQRNESYYNNNETYMALLDTLEKEWGKSVHEVKTLDEVLTPNFIKAIELILGKKESNKLQKIYGIITEGLYSTSEYRKSYRSAKAGDYIKDIIEITLSDINWIAVDKPLKEILTSDEYSPRAHLAYQIQIALAIRENDAEVTQLIEEAITGDNSNVKLTYSVIRGVIISGTHHFIELLGKLLLAGKLQEGLRQSILESMDWGTSETAAYFLKIVVENDLQRYAAVTRAMDTWTGLGFGDEKPAVVKKCLELALKALEDEEVRRKNLESDDVLEIYFSLWAYANNDIHTAMKEVFKLLESKEKYKRLLAMYFITGSDSWAIKHEVAAHHIRTEDLEELAWATQNLYVNPYAVYPYWSDLNDGENKGKKQPIAELPADEKERESQFDAFEKAAGFVGSKKRQFAESVFPWTVVELDPDRITGSMMTLAAYDMNEDMIDRLAGLTDIMGTNHRKGFYSIFCDPDNPKHKDYLLSAIQNDKSVYNKEAVVKLMEDRQLSDDDLMIFVEALKSKSSGLRKAVINVLAKQQPSSLKPVLEALLTAKQETKIQAGLELMSEFKDKDNNLFSYGQEFVEDIRTNKKLTEQTKILLDNLSEETSSKQKEIAKENGFGLIDFKSDIFHIDKQRSKLNNETFSEKELKKLIQVPEKHIRKFLTEMESVFAGNIDYEYETYTWGSRETIVFGTKTYSIYPEADRQKAYDESLGRSVGNMHPDYPLDCYPFHEEFEKVIEKHAKTPVELAVILSYLNTSGYSYNQNRKMFSEIEKAFKGYPIYTIDVDEYIFSRPITEILNKYMETFEKRDMFQFAMKVYRSLRTKIPEDQWMEKAFEPIDTYFGDDENTRIEDISYLMYWRDIAMDNASSDEEFTEFFNESWYEYLVCNKKIRTRIWIDGYLRACHIGIVDGNVIYERMLTSPAAQDYMRVLTETRYNRRSAHKDNIKMLNDYPFVCEMIDNAVDVILNIESRRGEMATEVSELASSIRRFEGSEYFAMLLAALGKDTFYRGYSYIGYDNKKSTLSSLLKNCYPKEEESWEDLKAALSAYKISDERLVEAAMYAPQWAEFIEKIVGWKGLKSGIWFYHAHVNENFSAEKETEVARFSSISPQQFNDGTFDRDWFFKVKEELGSKHLKVLYDSAKYISDGGNTHRRSQLYVDAVTGKLKATALVKEIKDKRNQDKLRAYPLIPIKGNQPGEPLKRYEVLQNFLKESKQFGAQRRASEAKSVEVALENLSITSGYNDVNRMTWYLESEKMDSLKPYFEGIELGEVKVYLNIEDDGTAGIKVEKGEKELKSIPKKYNKDKKVVELKDVVKELKDQKSRSRASLEKAMIDRTEFRSDELYKILGNPALATMMESMVWMCAGSFGFVSLDGDDLIMTGTDGASSKLNGDSADKLVLAHPYDMMSAGNWSAFQHYLYENQIIQPFKQVFREFYPLTEDEKKAANESLRYAGNQVQPQRTVGLLRGRGWTVDYDNGLQKVLYKEDVIAVVYSMADWFSPADIEAPTLETIRFYSRSDNEPVDFKNISSIAFSEVMRDMDLVVSVAHVGGVDPEASHSTVEMRTAIATELTKLLKLSNVEFASAHAKIKGSLGNYTVHMGSGVVHKEAKGMMSIIPVHSQARGRIFLPFADDDPKTSEIMSKILLLSEDDKIKDPSILGQI